MNSYGFAKKLYFQGMGAAKCCVAAVKSRPTSSHCCYIIMFLVFPSYVTILISFQRY